MMMAAARAGGAGNAKLVYTGSQFSNTNATSYNFANVAIGPADIDRLVIVTMCLSAAGSSALGLDALTMNGVAMVLASGGKTQLGTNTVSVQASYLVVPSGEVATIALTATRACTSAAFTVHVATGVVKSILTGLGDGNNNVSSLAADTNIAATDYDLIASVLGCNSSSANITWTGTDKDSNTNFESTLSASTGQVDRQNPSVSAISSVSMPSGVLSTVFLTPYLGASSMPFTYALMAGTDGSGYGFPFGGYTENVFFLGTIDDPVFYLSQASYSTDPNAWTIGFLGVTTEAYFTEMKNLFKFVSLNGGAKVAVTSWNAWEEKFFIATITSPLPLGSIVVGQRYTLTFSQT